MTTGPTASVMSCTSGASSRKRGSGTRAYFRHPKISRPSHAGSLQAKSRQTGERLVAPAFVGRTSRRAPGRTAQSCPIGLGVGQDRTAALLARVHCRPLEGAPADSTVGLHPALNGRHLPRVGASAWYCTPPPVGAPSAVELLVVADDSPVDRDVVPEDAEPHEPAELRSMLRPCRTAGGRRCP